MRLLTLDPKLSTSAIASTMMMASIVRFSSVSVIAAFEPGDGSAGVGAGVALRELDLREVEADLLFDRERLRASLTSPRITQDIKVLKASNGSKVRWN